MDNNLRKLNLDFILDYVSLLHANKELLASHNVKLRADDIGNQDNFIKFLKDNQVLV